MNAVLALLVGALVAASVLAFLRGRTTGLLVGFILLGQAVNLLVFGAGGLVAGRPPLVPPGQATPPPGSADPLPQALVLTAIVIGFGLTAFLVLLLRRLRTDQPRAGLDDLGPPSP